MKHQAYSCETYKTGLVCTAVAFSIDNNEVIGGYSDDSIRKFDFETGAELRVFDIHSNSVKDIKLTIDSKYLISSSDNGVIIVHERTCEIINTICCKENVPKAFALSAQKRGSLHELACVGQKMNLVIYKITHDAYQNIISTIENTKGLTPICFGLKYNTIYTGDTLGFI
jgi:WD40 repeat protein